MDRESKIKRNRMQYIGAVMGLIGLIFILLGDDWLQFLSTRFDISLNDHDYLEVLFRAIPITILIYGLGLIHKAKNKDC